MPLNDDDKIILLDLSGKGEFQKRITPRIFCDELIKSGMNKNVKSIDLYMSDVTPKYSLFSFAKETSDYFFNHYNLAINVRTPSNINFDYTLVVPPNITKHDWEIYGINNTNLNKDKKISFNYLYDLKDKTLLWLSDINCHSYETRRIKNS